MVLLAFRAREELAIWRPSVVDIAVLACSAGCSSQSDESNR